MPGSTTEADDAIVITGCGWVTAYAAGTVNEVLLRADADARHAAARPPYLSVSTAVLTAGPTLPAELTKDKGAWLAGRAASIAMQEAGVLVAADGASNPAGAMDQISPDRIGLVLGSSLAGLLGMIRFATDVRGQSARFVSPINFPQTVGNYVAGALARAFHLRGPNLTLAGSTAGLAAIREASSMLTANGADVVLAGGVEELSGGLASALGPPGAMLSEGACLFFLERESRAKARSAAVLARIPHHATAEPAQDRAADKLHSCCEPSVPTAVYIPAWLGHGLATAGPSALAAAIGAVRGLRVPRCGRTDPSLVEPGTLARRAAPPPGAATQVVVTQAGDAGPTYFEAEVPLGTTGSA